MNFFRKFSNDIALKQNLLQKENHQFQDREFDICIVGNSYTSPLLFTYLKKNLNISQSLCIMKDSDLETDWSLWKYLGGVRGEENEFVFKKLWSLFEPHLSILNNENFKIEFSNSSDNAPPLPTYLFKDYTFKQIHAGNKEKRKENEDEESEILIKQNLGGAKLSFEESYFSKAHSSVLTKGLDSLLGGLKDNLFSNEDNILQTLPGIITAIDYSDNTNSSTPLWILHTSQKYSIKAKNLIFLGPPSNFQYLMVENCKNRLELKTHTLLKEIVRKPLACLKNFYPNKSFSKPGTFIIPQASTYDKGNFFAHIQQQALFSENRSGEEVAALFFWFLKEDSKSSEEISKNLRNLKKAIQKIFPAMKSSSIANANEVLESLLVGNYFPILNLDDKLWNILNQNFTNLYFIGMDAPLSLHFLESLNIVNSHDFSNFKWSKINTLTRELLSLYFCINLLGKQNV